VARHARRNSALEKELKLLNVLRRLVGQKTLSVTPINFPPDGVVRLPTKHHAIVTLSEWKWQLICSKPERSFYFANGAKVATTLITPDSVRHHKTESTQFIYYKLFASIYLQTGGEIRPHGGVYFAVIIDTNTSRVCTVYPVQRPKPGKLFK
jgi:hypothetical protein